MLRIATWNINSVRLRIDIVKRLLTEYNLDVLCLQETKCPDGSFPTAALNAIGYHDIAIRGQPGYNGVAVISRVPFLEVNSEQFCGKDDARHIAVQLDAKSKPILHSLYVPAGGDVPDPDVNEKFQHKLQFLDEMQAWLKTAQNQRQQAEILTGDLNIAPLEHDVWSHKQLLKIVSHTPVETDALNTIQRTGRWVDIVREQDPEPKKLYSWWSYRAKDWSASDKGRRLDHIWCDNKTAVACSRTMILRDARGWEKPSDHAPVIAEFKL